MYRHFPYLSSFAVRSFENNTFYVLTSPVKAPARNLAIVVILSNGTQVSTGHKFEYRADPIITDITPRKHLTVWVFIYFLFIYLFIYLSFIYLFIYIFIYLFGKVKNKYTHVNNNKKIKLIGPLKTRRLLIIYIFQIGHSLILDHTVLQNRFRLILLIDLCALFLTGFCKS